MVSLALAISNMKSENVIKKVQKTYADAIRGAAAKNGNSRWGSNESIAVITALVELLVGDEEVGLEGVDAITTEITNVVNPSAFAQALETLPETNPCHIRRPEKGGRKGSKVAGLA